MRVLPAYDTLAAALCGILEVSVNTASNVAINCKQQTQKAHPLPFTDYQSKAEPSCTELHIVS